MDSSPNLTQIDDIPADRTLIEFLYSQEVLTPEARLEALRIVYPHEKWGIWISRILLLLGSTLILSGIVYFFAFNWAHISSFTKFSALEFGIIACCLGSIYYSLERLSGKILLLAASVLVGVFLAVFGQVYQTGADAYQLFAGWMALILGWVVVAKFTPLCALWFLLANTSLILYWQQQVNASHEYLQLIFVFVALLNSCFLVITEMLGARGLEWLNERWLRVVLVIATLLPLLIPTCSLIFGIERATDANWIGAIFSAFIHSAFYYHYVHRQKDMWVIAATILSLCCLAQTAAFKFWIEVSDRVDSVALLMSGICSLVIFSLAVVFVRRIQNSEDL